VERYLFYFFDNSLFQPVLIDAASIIAFNSAAAVSMDISTGAIQDKTPTGTHTYFFFFLSMYFSEMRSRYNNVMYFLIALKSLDVVYGMIYYVLDGRYFGGVLRMSEAEKLRDVQLQEAEGSKRQYPLKRPVKS